MGWIASKFRSLHLLIAETLVLLGRKAKSWSRGENRKLNIGLAWPTGIAMFGLHQASGITSFRCFLEPSQF